MKYIHKLVGPLNKLVGLTNKSATPAEKWVKYIHKLVGPLNKLVGLTNKSVTPAEKCVTYIHKLVGPLNKLVGYVQHRPRAFDLPVFIGESFVFIRPRLVSFVDTHFIGSVNVARLRCAREATGSVAAVVRRGRDRRRLEELS